MIVTMRITCRRCSEAVPLVEPYHRGTGGLLCSCGAWLIDPDVTYCLGAHNAAISVGGCKSCEPDTREPDAGIQIVWRDNTLRDLDHPWPPRAPKGEPCAACGCVGCIEWQTDCPIHGIDSADPTQATDWVRDRCATCGRLGKWHPPSVSIR